MSICSFFQLPNFICSELFTQWIDVKDLAKLDSAVVNRAQRKLFLEMIRDDYFVVKGSELFTLATYISWLSLRSLKIDKLVVLTSLFKNPEQLSRLNVSRLESLSFKTGTNFSSKTVSYPLLQRLMNFLGSAENEDHFQELLVRCVRLKHVDFGDESDSSFGKIGMFCAKLQSIRAVDCKGLNDTAVESIAQHCQSNLRAVVLHACTGITSASLIAIAENCPCITKIDLSYGSSFSERSLLQVAQHCPHLEHINLEGVNNISNAVIAMVARTCANLQYFNIDYYKGMSHEGTDPIALKLVADGCPSITDFISPEFHYRVRLGVVQLRLKGTYTRFPKLHNILTHCPCNVAVLNASGKNIPAQIVFCTLRVFLLCYVVLCCILLWLLLLLWLFLFNCCCAFDRG
jgi:hypothetical protein